MWHIIRAALLLCPSLIWDYFAWILKYSKHPEKYPIEKRYFRTRKLIRSVNRKLRIDPVIEGKENIPDGIACFFVNHLGAVDPLLLFEAMERPTTYVAKIELMKTPFVGRIFTGINGLFLDRSDLKQQLKVMMKVEASLKNKECNWVIYPEGTRNKDPMNRLLEFHKGTFRPAVKAGVPIVPVVSYGSFRILNMKHNYKKYPTYVKFLPPIYPEEYQGKTTDEIAAIVQSRIQKEVSFVAKPLDHKRMSELHDKYYRFNKIK